MTAITYPELISLQTDTTIKNPFTNKTVSIAKEEQYKGIVSASGKWLQEAGAGWKVELPETGHYIIRHNHGYTSYSSNISLLGKPGNITTNIMNEYVLDIQITDTDGIPVNEDFAVCMSITQKIVA